MKSLFFSVAAAIAAGSLLAFATGTDAEQPLHVQNCCNQSDTVVVVDDNASELAVDTLADYVDYECDIHSYRYADDYPLANLSSDYREKKYDKILRDADEALGLRSYDDWAAACRSLALAGLGRDRESLESFLPTFLISFAYDYNEVVPAEVDSLFLTSPKISGTFDYSIIMDQIAGKNPQAYRAMIDQIRGELPAYLPSDCMVQPLFSLWGAWYDRGCNSSAMGVADEIEACGNTAWADIARAQSYIKVGDYDKAIAKIDNLLAENPASVSLLNLKGMALGRSRGPEVAEKFFADMTDLESVPLLIDMAMFGTLTDNTERAEATLRNLLESESDEAASSRDEIRLRLGILYARKGDKAKAAETLQPLFDNPDTYKINQALAYAWLGEKDKVLDLIPYIREHEEPSDLQLAGIYSAAGEEGKAMEIVAKLIETGRMHPSFIRTDSNLNRLKDNKAFQQAALRFNPDGGCQSSAE